MYSSPKNLVIICSSSCCSKPAFLSSVEHKTFYEEHLLTIDFHCILFFRNMKVSGYRQLFGCHHYLKYLLCSTANDLRVWKCLKLLQNIHFWVNLFFLEILTVMTQDYFEMFQCNRFSSQYPTPYEKRWCKWFKPHTANYQGVIKMQNDSYISCVEWEWRNGKRWKTNHLWFFIMQPHHSGEAIKTSLSHSL